MNEIEILGTTDAAKEIGLSRTRLAAHIAVGQLKAVRVGKSYVITRPDFERFKVELAERREQYGWPKLEATGR